MTSVGIGSVPRKDTHVKSSRRSLHRHPARSLLLAGSAVLAILLSACTSSGTTANTSATTPQVPAPSAGSPSASSTKPTAGGQQSTASGSGGTTMGQTQVAAQIASTLERAGVRVDSGSLSCPSGLVGAAGQTIRCEFTVQGQPVDAIAKISAISADGVRFDLTTQAKAIDQGLLQREVAGQITDRTGIPVELVTCTGDLQPTVNKTTNCTVTQTGVATIYSVRVTKVSGGKIEYGIDAT